jgi:hypothetical protein
LATFFSTANVNPTTLAAVMKKTILITNFMLCAVLAMAQQLSPDLKKGSVINLAFKDYNYALKPAFKPKMKADERARLAAQFNERILSGQTPFTSSPISVGITDIYNGGSWSSYATKYSQQVANSAGGKSTMVFNGVIYSDPDTITYFLNAGPYYSVYNQDTVGTMMFGGFNYPKNIDVGSKLLPVHSYYVSTPTVQAKVIMHKVLSGVRIRPTLQDVPRDYFPGAPLLQTDKAVVSQLQASYQQIPVGVITEVQLGMDRYWNMEAVVSEKKEITISGKTFTAYVIQAEEWMSPMNTTFDVTTYTEKMKGVNDKLRAKAEADVLKKEQKTNAKVTDKTNNAITNTNDLGYVVFREERWYVPELGMDVKKIHYTGEGLIDYIVEPASIKF